MAPDPVLLYTVELYRQGFSLRGIARMVSSRFGIYVSKDWVRRRLIALGVYVPKRPRSNQVSHVACSEMVAGLLPSSRRCFGNQVSHEGVSCLDVTSSPVSQVVDVTSKSLSHGVEVTSDNGVSSSVSYRVIEEKRYPRPSLLGLVSRRILEAAVRLQVFTPSTLAFHIKLDPHLVKKYLWRLRRTGYVERLRRGLYRASARICSLLPLICSSKAPIASNATGIGQNVIGEAGGGAPSRGFGGGCGVNGLVLYVAGHCGFVCLRRRGFGVVGRGRGGKVGRVIEVLGRRVRVLCGYSGGCEVIVSGSFTDPGELEEFLGVLSGELSRVLGVEVRPGDLSVLRVDLHCDLYRGSLQFGAGQFAVGDLVAYLRGGVDGDGPLRIEERVRRRKNEMGIRELLDLFEAHVNVASSIARLHREIAEVKAGLKRVMVETVFNKQPATCRLSDEEYKKIIDAAWRGLGPGLRQQLRQLWEAGLLNVIEPLYRQAVRQCGEIVIKEIIPELIKALRENNMLPSREPGPDEYRSHPGWGLLEELQENGIVSINRNTVYYGPDLWRYIRSRTSSGSIRGLDKKLLKHIRDYYGENVVKLLLAMQIHGGKIPIEKALNILAGIY